MNKLNLLLGILLYHIVIINCSETMQDAASYARYLVQNENYGVFATIDLDGLPFSFMEDFAELFDNSTVHLNNNGSIIFLLSSQSLNYIAWNGGFSSFTIYQKNCSVYNYDNMPFDQRACIQFTITGQVLLIYNELYLKTFLCKHPAAEYWLKPNKDPEQTYSIAIMEIMSIYYIGGYYDSQHYIGQIDLKIYQNAKIIEPK